MNAIQSYLAENAKWMSDASIAAIEAIPVSAWPAVLEGVDILVGGKDPGIDCGIVVTRETLSDFDAARSNHWNKQGARSARTLNDLMAVHYSQFQLRKGDHKRDQIVIDAGDIRISLHMG